MPRGVSAPAKSAVLLLQRAKKARIPFDDSISRFVALNLPQGYFAGFFLLFLAAARRSIFFRRRARFLTLSLPWLCPIGVNTRLLPRGSQTISQVRLKIRFQSGSAMLGLLSDPISFIELFRILTFGFLLIRCRKPKFRHRVSASMACSPRS